MYKVLSYYVRVELNLCFHAAYFSIRSCNNTFSNQQCREKGKNYGLLKAEKWQLIFVSIVVTLFYLANTIGPQIIQFTPLFSTEHNRMSTFDNTYKILRISHLFVDVLRRILFASTVSEHLRGGKKSRIYSNYRMGFVFC